MEDWFLVLENERHFHALVNTVINLLIARFEVLEVVLMKIQGLLEVTPLSTGKYLSTFLRSVTSPDAGPEQSKRFLLEPWIFNLPAVPKSR